MADIIDEMKKEWQLRHGSDLTPAKAAEQFTLMPFETRVAHLRSIETPEAMNLRSGAERHAFLRAIRRTHETLRKVGR
jgi:hypothetical protein